MNRFLGHPGWAIIALSIAVSTLTLPLYLKADTIQHKEREKQKYMSKWMKHLRKHFSGDEYFMMVNAYYKEQNYSPLYAVKGSLSLLFQIPFFIAAYHFLSHLSILDNQSFGIITNLGSEDGLIRIAENPVNFLPILMTCINLISVLIYTGGFSLKNRLQPILLALIFLVLLYHSPSGLVLYWTMNNIYSLMKNLVVEKSKHPQKIVFLIISFLLALYVVYTVKSGKILNSFASHDFESLIIYFAGFFILLLPLLSMTIHRNKKQLTITQEVDDKKTILIEESILFTIFGLMLPLSVLSSSPDEFLFADQGMSPWHYVIFTIEVSFGLFYLWLGVFYKMSNNKNKIEHFLFSAIPVLIMHIFCYKAPIGMISIMIEFDKVPKYSRGIKFLNLLLIGLLLLAFYKIKLKFTKFSEGVLVVLLLTVLSFSGIYALKMINSLSKSDSVTSEFAADKATFTLSKTGKNVVVIFLDRADGVLIPFIFNEKPQLASTYSGFTFYPNTIAFGRSTIYGAPPLCGGYEYAPAEMNNRSDEYLVDKHNEALMLLPVIFNENGFKVTAADLPHGNYSAYSDMSIFDDYPDINALTLIGTLPAGYDLNEYQIKRERNLFFYGFYKASPAMIQDDIYDTGGYLAADREYVIGTQRFRDAFTVLKNLTNLTTISNTGDNTFLMMYNNAPHESTLLTLPNYDVSGVPDYTGIDIAADKYDAEGNVLHFDRDNIESYVGQYHSLMGSLLQLGIWFDYLRENNVYDNTRIIIVSDHGSPFFTPTVTSHGKTVEVFNPMFMVKDFNSSGDLSVDNAFMTHADTPALATYNLIDSPVNPFTGNTISMNDKKDGATIFFGETPKVDTSSKTFGNGDWYHVHDNIFEGDNWTKID